VLLKRYKNLINNYMDTSSTLKINDNFWLNNPQILIEPKRLSEFFPNQNMTTVEQLNSIVRFCFYLSIILMLLKQNINYIYLFIISLVITFGIYQYDPKLKIIEKKETFGLFDSKSKRDKDKNYVKPTYSNPFMNPSLLDYTENPNREAYSKKSFISNNDLKLDIEEKFSYNLYQDVNDIFGKTNSQRQFYTTPVTTIPNEQSNFANWLYGTPDSCKDNNGYQCMTNNPVFYNGSSPPIIY
jgi:hypothetical protein